MSFFIQIFFCFVPKENRRISKNNVHFALVSRAKTKSFESAHFLSNQTCFLLLFLSLQFENKKQFRYYRANSVRYTTAPCDSVCALNHYCAITRVDYHDFRHCLESAASALASNSMRPRASVPIVTHIALILAIYSIIKCRQRKLLLEWLNFLIIDHLSNMLQAKCTIMAAVKLAHKLQFQWLKRKILAKTALQMQAQRLHSSLSTLPTSVEPQNKSMLMQKQQPNEFDFHEISTRTIVRTKQQPQQQKKEPQPMKCTINQNNCTDDEQRPRKSAMLMCRRRNPSKLCQTNKLLKQFTQLASYNQIIFNNAMMNDDSLAIEHITKSSTYSSEVLVV